MKEPSPDEVIVSDHFTDDSAGPILTGVCSLLWRVIPPEALNRALGAELKGLEMEMRREYKRLRDLEGLPT